MNRNVAKTDAARVKRRGGGLSKPWRKFRNAIEIPFGKRRGQEKGKGSKLQELKESGMARNVAKRGAERAEGAGRFWKLWRKMPGGFEVLEKDAIRQLRNAIETPFGKRCGQEKTNGSCRGLGKTHGQDYGKIRYGNGNVAHLRWSQAPPCPGQAGVGGKHNALA